MEDNRIVVFKNGKLCGPYSRAALRAALKAGSLDPNMPARPVSLQKLCPLRDLITISNSQKYSAENQTLRPTTIVKHETGNTDSNKLPMILTIAGITLAITVLFAAVAVLIPSGEESEAQSISVPGNADEINYGRMAENVSDAQKATLMIKNSGSAFIAKTTDGTFVYTAAHCALSEDIEFFDFRGNKISTEKNPEVVVGNDGHDLVRFRLLTPTPIHLVLATREEIEAKPIVYALGNSHGENVLTTLEGKVVGIGPGKVEVDCAFIFGNSGGPIITPDGKVVGVVSYLRSDPSIWARDTELEVRRFAWIPCTKLQWASFSASQLREEAEAIKKIWCSYVVLAALREVTLGGNGIKWDNSTLIVGEINLEMIFAKADDHPLIRGLHATSNEVRLQRDRKESELQIIRSYQRFLRSCIEYSSSQLAESHDMIKSSYHRKILDTDSDEFKRKIDSFNQHYNAFERNPQLGRRLSSYR